MAFPVIAFNPATAAAVTKALAPVARSVSSAVSQFGALLRKCTPEKMAQAFSANPRLAGAMEKMGPHIQKMTSSLTNSSAFQRLMQGLREHAGEYLQDAVHNAATASVDKPVKQHDLNAYQQLFPPGAHTLSSQSFSGKLSMVSAMVGKERWHVLVPASGAAGASGASVSRTDWQTGANGIHTCKTWEPATQRNWNWMQNKVGDQIAMGDPKPAQDGGNMRSVFHYPADGGPVSFKLLHQQADGRFSLVDPGGASGARRPGQAKAHAPTESRAAAQDQPGFVIEVMDDEVVRAASDRQALVRRTART